MRKLVSFFGFLVIASLALPLSAHAQKAELFGGYSYVRLDTSPGSENFNGWNASLDVNTFKILGFKADFGERTPLPPASAHICTLFSSDRNSTCLRLSFRHSCMLCLVARISALLRRALRDQTPHSHRPSEEESTFILSQ